MKFKEYLENLNKLAEERPETLEFDVVSAIDDEGNGYNMVCYGPSVGNYDKKNEEFQDEVKLNAICIN